jgi:hypothetical protein
MKKNNIYTTGAKTEQEAELKRIQLRSKLNAKNDVNHNIIRNENFTVHAVPPPPASESFDNNKIGNESVGVIPIASPINHNGILLEGGSVRFPITNNSENNQQLNNINNLTMERERIELLRNRRIIYIENLKCFSFVIFIGLVGFIFWKMMG